MVTDSHFEYAYKAVKFPIFLVLLTSTKFQEYNIISIHKCITDGSKKHSIGLCTQISRVNQLSPWDLVIFPELPEGYQISDFEMNQVRIGGKYRSLVFIWALNYIFSSETVVMQKNRRVKCAWLTL